MPHQGEYRWGCNIFDTESGFSGRSRGRDIIIGNCKSSYGEKIRGSHLLCLRGKEAVLRAC